MKTIITTPNAPSALGPYSQGIAFGNLLFASGQLGIDPQTNELPDDLEIQTRNALKNLSAVLEAGNSHLENALKVTIFLKDMNDFSAVNAIYSEFFPRNCPARECVEVARLPKDARVEISAIAQIL